MVGHGGYLVSANAGILKLLGVWSHIDSTNNNLVKAFNFYTNDIVSV